MAHNGSRSILIVDDDAVSREVMAMTLEMHGYSVAQAEDGDDAVAQLKSSGAPELILMDSQMPGLSGVELIAALHASGAGRVVAISASDPGEALRRAADDFLLKPVEPEAVAALFSSPLALAAAAELAPRADISGAGVDPVTLAKFRAMMPASAVREIYEATAADLKTRLTTLESAIEADDKEQVARVAHSIKGSCAMVGMTAGRNAADRLETGDLSGSWSAEVTHLRIALEALEVMLASDFSA